MNSPEREEKIADSAKRAEIHALLPTLVARAPGEAASMLDPYADDFIAEMLMSLNPALAQSVLERFKSDAAKKSSRPLPRRLGCNGSETKGIRKIPLAT